MVIKSHNTENRYNSDDDANKELKLNEKPIDGNIKQRGNLANLPLIIGDEPTVEEKLAWLRSIAPQIREEVGRRITLKYLPKFEYILDKSAARSARILQVLDEIEHPRDEEQPGA